MTPKQLKLFKTILAGVGAGEGDIETHENLMDRRTKDIDLTYFRKPQELTISAKTIKGYAIAWNRSLEGLTDDISYIETLNRIINDKTTEVVLQELRERIQEAIKQAPIPTREEV